MAIKLSRDMRGRAGEHFVAGELNRRGAYASPWAGNLPDIDIVAMNADREKAVFIQVKTKGSFETWHGDYRLAWELPKEKDIACLYWKMCNDSEHAADGRQRVNLKGYLPRQSSDTHFWVFVKVEDPPKEVSYWVVPDEKVRETVRNEVEKGLSKTGHRPRNPRSTHYGFIEKHLSEYQGKWSLLGLGLADD